MRYSFITFSVSREDSKDVVTFSGGIFFEKRANINMHDFCYVFVSWVDRVFVLISFCCHDDDYSDDVDADDDEHPLGASSPPSEGPLSVTLTSTWDHFGITSGSLWPHL